MIKLALLLCFLLAPAAAAAEKESAYDRVIKSGTLRCGYGIFAPMILKDPNTGEMTGIFADIMQAVGKVAGLKIEFVEEVDWGQIPQALQSGRIDAMCAGMWGTAKRGKSMAFSDPLFYSAAHVYARADDKRFDNNLSAIDDRSVKISVNDGDISLDIADRLFPQAQRVYKVQMAGEDFLLMNVATGKADVTFTAPSIAKDYMTANPGRIRQVENAAPLAINQNVIAVDIHEQELQDVLNAAIAELKNNGEIERIFKTYKPEEVGDFLLTLDKL